LLTYLSHLVLCFEKGPACPTDAHPRISSPEQLIEDARESGYVPLGYKKARLAIPNDLGDVSVKS